MGERGATSKEGDYSASNASTGFANLIRVKDEDIVVLSRDLEDKEEDVPPSGFGLS